jgi:hypothetical protein
MRNLIVALTLMGINVILFLLLDFVYAPNVNINKLAASVVLGVLVLVMVTLLILNPGQYLVTALMSVVSLLGLIARAALHMLTRTERQNAGRNEFTNNIFDTIFFSVFAAFACISQCLGLLVWS